MRFFLSTFIPEYELKKNALIRADLFADRLMENGNKCFEVNDIKHRTPLLKGQSCKF